MDADAHEGVAKLLTHLLHADESTRTPSAARTSKLLDDDATRHKLRQGGEGEGGAVGSSLVGLAVHLVMVSVFSTEPTSEPA